MESITTYIHIEPTRSKRLILYPQLLWCWKMVPMEQKVEKQSLHMSVSLIHPT